MIFIWKVLPNLEYGSRDVGIDCAYDKFPQSGWHLNIIILVTLPRRSTW